MVGLEHENEAMDIFTKLARLEMEAEAREEEYERKRLELEERIEENRREKEAEHTERMLAMFASFFGQMTQMFHSNQPQTHVTHPTPIQSSHHCHTQSQPLFSLSTHNTIPFCPTNPPQPPVTSQNST